MTRFRRLVLRSYPSGIPTDGNFGAEEADICAVGEGEVLVRVTHLSMDPFPRLRMAERSPVGPPMRLGHVVEGRGLGEIVESRHPAFAPGQWVTGELGWQELAVLPGAALTPIDLSLGPPERHLSVLGPSGLTAYFTVEALGEPGPEETVLIAPAAGSVGSLAGQIAKRRRSRTVGVGRGERQCQALTGELGFDAAIDSEQIEVGLEAAGVAGIDMFLDGVGGALHEALLPRLNPRARVVLLGFIAAYNDGRPPRYGQAAPILMKRARMEGFLLADWAPRFDEARQRLSEWLRDGTLVPRESIWRGLDQAPSAFAALFGEAPAGKQIVQLQWENRS